MITVTTLVVLVAAYLLYKHLTTLQPMSALQVRELYDKFHAAFKDIEPKPKLDFQLNQTRQPSYLYITQEHNNFLMLSWDNGKTPSLKKYTKDKHYYATHQFLEHFNIKLPH